MESNLANNNSPGGTNRSGALDHDPLPARSAIRISVVTPTFNRREELQRLLESLWNQTLNKETFEVIIACDGSTDGTIEMVKGFQRRAWNLTLLELRNGGPAAARNAGAKVAKGAYIAFTDDDCVATEAWLQAILDTFDKTGAVGLQGRTTTIRDQRTPLTHQIEVLRPWPSTVPTCNAAYTRSVFEAVGGFDESFPFPHNEDADLAWRVQNVGPISYVTEMHIIHPPRPDPFLKHARAVKMLQSDFLLFYKDPGNYKRYISRDPWWTIYWAAFVVHQASFARACVADFLGSMRPRYLFQGLGLIVARWFYLIYYFPMYRQAERRYREQPLSPGG